MSFSALEHDLEGDGPAPRGDSPPRLDVLGPQGETLRSLDLTAPVLTVGQAPGNQLVLDADGVSRYHMRIAQAGGRVTVTDLGGRGGTLLNEQRLPPHVETPMPPGASLRAGPFRMRLSDPHVGGASAALAAPDVAAGSLALAIAGGRETLELTPGQPTVVVLTLANNGAAPDSATLAVEGIPAEWVRLPEGLVPVEPGTPVSLSIQVAVPREPESLASEYVVTLRARSQNSPSEIGVVSARWTVLPFSGGSLEVRPRKRLVRGLGAATYLLAIENGGNQPASFTLRVGDDEPSLDYQLDQSRVTLAAGASATVRLVAQARENPGGRAQSYSFSVRAQPSVGTPLLATAQLTQQRPFPIWLVPVALLALLALFGLSALTWWLLTGANRQQVANAAGITPVASDIALVPTAGAEMTLDEALRGTQTAIAAVNMAQIQQTEVAGAIAAAQAQSQPTIQALIAALNSAQAAQTAQAAQVAQQAQQAAGQQAAGQLSPAEQAAAAVQAALAAAGFPVGGAGAGTGTNTAAGGGASSSQALPTYTPYPTFTSQPTATTTSTPTSTPSATPTPTATTPATADSVFLSHTLTGNSFSADAPIPAFIVKLVDLNGTVVKSVPGVTTVTVTIATSGCTKTTPAQLEGTVSVPFTNGVATFSDLQIKCAGTGYKLKFTADGGVKDILSDPFAIVAGQATALAFELPPNSAQIDTPLTAGASGVPIKVIMLDASGNIAKPASSINITIKITPSNNNPPGVSLGGTLTQPADATKPFAEFADLTISKLGNYTLTASVSNLSLSSAQSQSFAITDNKLAFDAGNPASGRAANNVTIKVNATNGATIDTSFQGQVTLSLLDSSNAAVGTALKVNATNGVVPFDLLLPPTAGSYTLQASAPPTYAPITSTIKVVASALRFEDAPQNTVAGSILNVTKAVTSTATVVPGTIRVQALDGNGNPAPSGSNITLTLVGTCPTAGSSGFFQTGPTYVQALTVTPDATGLATFSGLRIDCVGANYKLTATDGTDTITGPTFNITANQLRIFGPGGPAAGATSYGPLSRPADTPFDSAIEVRATDAFGNTDTTFPTTALSFGLAGGPFIYQFLSPAVLTVTGSNMVGGRLALNVLSIDRLTNMNGTNAPYTITVSGGGLNSVTLTSVSITASRLSFQSPVANTQVNTAFAVSLGASDRYGTYADRSFAPATVALTLTDAMVSPLGTLQLSDGTTSGPTSISVPITAGMITNGVVSIPTLSINRVGQGYTLAASAGALTSTPSNAFNITADRYRLFSSTLPAAGATISTSLTLQAEQPLSGVMIKAVDEFGNVDTTQSGAAVTARLVRNSNGTTPVSALRNSLIAPTVPVTTTTLVMTGGSIPLSSLSIDKVTNNQLDRLIVDAQLNPAIAPAQLEIRAITVYANQLRISFPNQLPPFQATKLFSVTVEAVDGYGTLDTRFPANDIQLSGTTITGTTTLTNTVLDPANGLPCRENISGGSVTFNTVKIMEAGQTTIQATGGLAPQSACSAANPVMPVSGSTTIGSTAMVAGPLHYALAPTQQHRKLSRSPAVTRAAGAAASPAWMRRGQPPLALKDRPFARKPPPLT